MTTGPETLCAVLVDEIARAGVRHACIAPGSRSGPLALALAAEPRIEVHVVLDERSAGFVALGIGKASGHPAAVVTTSGTAAANLLPSVVEAHHSRTPLLALTADRPPELRDTGALQTIDQRHLFGRAARWFAELEPPEGGRERVAYWRSVAARACVTACASPPGPVHLNIPLREPLLSADAPRAAPLADGAENNNRPWVTSRPPRLLADDRVLEQLSARVARAQRGVVVAGPGPYDPEAIAAFAAAARWPLLAEPTSGARFGPSAICAYDALLRNERFAADHRPDLVLRVGGAGVSKALSAWLDRSVSQVLIDPDGLWLDPQRAVEELIQADPALVCASLASSTARSSTTWLDRWLESDRIAQAAIDEVLEQDDGPSEPRSARDLAAGLPPGSTLVIAASMPVRDLDSFMSARTGIEVIANRGANGIDGFVSTVLGVAAVRAPVVALTGDLSLLHDQNGLMYGRSAHRDAVFVVLNNDGGGIFSFLPQARREHFEALFATPQHADLRALAASHHCTFASVTNPDELVPAVSEAVERGGQHIVEVRTDRARNVELHARIWDRVARRLDDARSGKKRPPGIRGASHL